MSEKFEPFDEENADQVAAYLPEDEETHEERLERWHDDDAHEYELDELEAEAQRSLQELRAWQAERSRAGTLEIDLAGSVRKGNEQRAPRMRGVPSDSDADEVTGIALQVGAAIAKEAELPEIPHPSDTGRLYGTGPLGMALRAAAEAKAILEKPVAQLTPFDLHRLADASAASGLYWGAHKYQALQTAYGAKEEERLLDKVKSANEAAEAKRQQYGREPRARAAWAKNPTARAWAIAKEIMIQKEEQGSVAKSIMQFAPITSPSHPSHPDYRGKKPAKAMRAKGPRLLGRLVHSSKRE